MTGGNIQWSIAINSAAPERLCSWHLRYRLAELNSAETATISRLRPSLTRTRCPECLIEEHRVKRAAKALLERQ